MQPIRQIFSGLIRTPTSADDHHTRQKAVCDSVVRMLHRFGMSGHAEILPINGTGQAPALIVTVERAMAKVSLTAMSMLSREIVAHALRKYGTEIEATHWRIDVDFDKPDLLHDAPLGYSMNDTFCLDHDLEDLGKMINAFETKIVEAERTLPVIPPIDDMARHIRDSFDKRRAERGLAVK